MVPETNQERPLEPQTSERKGSDAIEIKDLRAAFHKLEESKSRFIERIKEIRSTSSDNASTRARAEAQLQDAQDQLAESNERLRTLQEEVSSLKAELDTAKGLLEEIDKTLT